MLPNNEIINDMKETSSIELNGINFFFSKTSHEKRRLLCGFLTKHANELKSGNMYDMISDEEGFSEVEKIISELTLVGGPSGNPVSSMPEFWEENEGTYIEFIIYAMTYYSLNFMKDLDFSSPKDEIIESMKKNSSIELDGINFNFTKTVHKNRLLICSFLTKHAKCLQEGNIYDMIKDEKGFSRIEQILSKIVMVDGKQLKLYPNFWEDKDGAFIGFVIYAMTYYSLPFMKGRG